MCPRDSCPGANCGSLIQYRNGSGWSTVSDATRYWSGGTTTSRSTAMNTYGNGAASSARWRYVFVQPNSGSISFYRFRFGDSTKTFAP